MQKSKKEIKTEVEVFIAEDGKEFTTQCECENYERRLRVERLLNEVKKIEKADINMPPVGYGYANDKRYTYAWFRPKSEQEISVLNKYFKSSFSRRGIGIGFDGIGEWICIEFEGGSDIENFNGVAHRLEFDVSLRNTVDFYTALGYSVEISRADTGEVIASSKDKGGVG